MPRLLWLGAIVCALGVLASVVYVLTDEHARDAIPELHARFEHEERVAAELSDAASPMRTVAAAPRVDVPEKAKSSIADGIFSELGAPGSQKKPAFGRGVVSVHVVRDEDGAPIFGIEVEPGSRAFGGAPPPPPAVTAHDGTATFTGLADGSWSFSASAEGRAIAKETVLLDANVRTVSLELRLPVLRVVEVQLVDALGGPFRGAEWGLARVNATQLGIACTRNCGRLDEAPDITNAPIHRTRSASDLGPSSWRIEIRGAGAGCVQAVLGDVVVGLTPLDAAATRVQVRVDPSALDAATAPIVLRVVDAISSAPIVGASVELPSSLQRGAEFLTGADGSVRIPIAFSGSMSIHVLANGYAKASARLTRSSSPEFVVRMHTGRRVSGSVLDSEGAPLAGATVGVWDERAGTQPMTVSNRHGEYVLEGLEASELVIYSQAPLQPGHIQAESSRIRVDCRNGNVSGVELRTPKGWPTRPVPR